MSTQIEKFTAIADKIREKTNSAEPMTANDFVDKIDDVYSAGQSSMVDESKIIKKEAKGVGSLHLNDVSEIPHKIDCKVESVNLFRIDNLPQIINNVTLSKEVDESGLEYYVLNGTASKSTNFETSIGYLSGGEYTISDNKPVAVTDTSAADTALMQIYSPTTGKGYNTLCDDVNGIRIISNLEEASDYRCRIRIHTGVTYDNFIIKPMLNRGTEALPYTPYVAPESVEVTVTNDDGSYEQTYTYKTIKDMVSTHETSPIMNILTNTDVNMEVTYNRSYGMQTEYDRFWDKFQQSGTRGTYSYAFAYQWDENIFTPKYDIVPVIADYMFRAFPCTAKPFDLVDKLQELNINLDFSKCTNMSSLTSYSYISRMGVVDMRACAAHSTTFGYSNELKTIDKIIVDENNTFANAVFRVPKLEDITVEGTVASDISFQYCTRLTKESITSIINALGDETIVAGKTLTLSQTAVNTAFETSEGAADGETSEEWNNLISTKTNWTITLL